MSESSSNQDVPSKGKSSAKSGEAGSVSDAKSSSIKNDKQSAAKKSGSSGKDRPGEITKSKGNVKSKKKTVSRKKAVKKKTVRKVDKQSLERSAEEKEGAKPVEPDLFDKFDQEDWSEDGDIGRGPNIIEGMGSLIGGVRSISTSAFRLAREKTVDSATKMIQQSPDQLERMAKAGRSLQDLRSVAGVSVDEVATAIDLKNPDLLKAVEEGKAALPFEILLRLSSFYARNNPIPFILQYARTYNPLISNTLEKIGIDRLVITAEREIQFVQILRSRDAARELSDEDFKRVHAFTEKAFDMALNFAAGESDDDKAE